MARIYVSSTFKDLEVHREKVRTVLRRMGHEDVAMEYFVAEDKRPLDKCLEEVASCDLYIGIFAWRYGYVPDGYDKSITELEYRKAVETGKSCLFFLLDENAPWPRKFIDRGQDAERIAALRKELLNKYIVSFFSSLEELVESVTNAVHHWENNRQKNSFKESEKSKKATSFSKVERGEVAEEAIKKNTINDRYVDDQENDALDFKIYVNALRDFITSSETETPLVIGIDGSWGSGKTSLMQMLRKELDPQKSYFKSGKEFFIQIFWLIKYLIGKLFFLLLTVISKITLEFNLTYLEGFITKLKNKQLMSTLCSWRKCRDPETHFSVWFNAWRYDNEEQLWAAVALSLIDEIKKRYNPVQFFVFWLRLSLKRFSWKGFTYFVLKVVVISFILTMGFFAWFYYLYSSGVESLNYSEASLYLLSESSTKNIGQYMLYVGGFVTLLLATIEIFDKFKNILNIPVSRVFEKPNYENKIGFIRNFNADFSNIVLGVTKSFSPVYKPRKLIIFIDDLDRCKPSKVVDIIESVNLFLDSKGCVFIIGMDSKVVTACIETRYKEVTEETLNDFKGFERPGRLFLDKIIQLTLRVPKATKGDIENLVKKITEHKKIESAFEHLNAKKDNDIKTGENQISLKSELKPQLPITISYSNEDVANAIKLGSSLLNENPRQVKRFINTFRLYAYIANYRGLFEERSLKNKSVGLNLDRLAIWVAFSLRWGGIIDSMLLSSNITNLRSYLLTISNSLSEEKNYTLPQNKFDILLGELDALRDSPDLSPRHWCNFPWEAWCLEPDFLKAVNKLECFWSEPIEHEPDWLNIALKMAWVVGDETF